MTQEFRLKNMVCDRCIKVLKDEISAEGIHIESIELGLVLCTIDDETAIEKLKIIFKKNGFELLISENEKVTELVKVALIKLLQDLPFEIQQNLSDYLSNMIHSDYSKISKSFSVQEGITIEKYFIRLKIEKVKELIQTGNENFTEISQLLGYSNVNHLSSQFKSITGVSLSQYKGNNINLRTTLDKIL